MSNATDPQLAAEELNPGIQPGDTQAGSTDSQDQEDPDISATQGEQPEQADDRDSDTDRQETGLSRRQRAELRRQEELRSMREQLEFLQRLVVSQNGMAAQSTEQSEPEELADPRLEDYEGRSIQDYLTDMGRVIEQRAQRRAAEQARMALEQARQAEEQQRQREILDARVREARKELADWEAVMRQAHEDGIVVEPDVAQFIAESETGPRIAYHLAKNPDLHERINRLSVTRRLAELGKLEEQLQTAQPAATRRVSQAPATLSKTPGRAALAPLDPAVAARQGYAAWKQADLARQQTQRRK